MTSTNYVALETSVADNDRDDLLSNSLSWINKYMLYLPMWSRLSPTKNTDVTQYLWLLLQ